MDEDGHQHLGRLPNLKHIDFEASDMLVLSQAWPHMNWTILQLLTVRKLLDGPIYRINRSASLPKIMIASN